MSCIPLDVFLKHVKQFNQVTINPDTEKNLRFQVWDIKPEHVHKLINSQSSEGLPGRNDSTHVLAKIDNALNRIRKSEKKASQFIEDIVGNDGSGIDSGNITNSVALHEVMEAIKGEANKARNNSIDLELISENKFLPRLPLSRVAASIGRKIMYSNQSRFKSNVDSVKNAAEVEQMYYTVGLNALRDLEAKGYVNMQEGEATIADYDDSQKSKDTSTTNATVTTNARSVTLNTKKLGLSKYQTETKNNKSPGLTDEASYFLNKQNSSIQGTELGTIVDILGVIRNVTQPSAITTPDLGSPDSERNLKDGDPDGNVQSPSTEKAREKLYKNPLYVNSTVHEFLKLLSRQGSDSSGESAIRMLTAGFAGNKLMLQSLFGIKFSDDHSVDRKDSVSGQNLSKTIPLNDIVELYEMLSDQNGGPEALHLALKGGRNQRLYYDNSVLNPHASKQSRYMLTAGTQEVEVGTDDYQRLVYAISESFDGSLTFKDIVEGGNAKLDSALEVFSKFENTDVLQKKIVFLSRINNSFPSKDYASLITGLKAVQDVRNQGSTGFVATEFMSSSDAVAQGATIMFQQALSTNPNVQVALEKLGLVSNENGDMVAGDDPSKLKDIYALMSRGIKNFISGSDDSLVIADADGMQSTLENTLKLLFGDTAKGQRDFAKNPTMTFIYGQGPKGAVISMSETLAVRILDNLTDANTRKYLALIMDDDKLSSMNSDQLNDIEGLYEGIKSSLIKKGIPAQLYSIMKTEIEDVYLKQFKADGNSVYAFAEKVPNNHKLKVLPLGAVLDGIKVDQVEKYGMPLTKIVEVSSPVTGESTDALVEEGGHTVITRKQQLFKSIMDVSVIHGVDSGLLYHAINEVVGDTGAVVVHDEIRGSVKLVREVEAAYIRLNKRMVAEYDTHQQVMEAIAHYSPEVASGSDFKALKAKIDKRVEAKRKIVESGAFSEVTDTLIGDGLAYKEFAKGQVTKEATPENVTKEPIKSTSKPGTDLTSLLRNLAPQSPIIARFLEMSDKPAILGDRNKFDTENDQVVLSLTDDGVGAGVEIDADSKVQKELIEHEIIHHNTAGYIAKVLSGKQGAQEKKVLNYLQRAVKEITVFLENGTLEDFSAESLGEGVYDRMVDITDTKHNPEVKLAEFIAVMAAEPDIAAGIYKAIAGKVPTKTLKETIANFIEFVTAYIMDFTADDFSKELTANRIQDALVYVTENGRSFKEDRRTEAALLQKGFADLKAGSASTAVDLENKATIRYLNSAVSSMLNSKLERNGKRLIGTLNSNMRDRFPVYDDVMKKMQGIYDGSEGLQQLMHTITGEGTNKTSKANLLAQSALIASEQLTTIAFQSSELNKALKGMSAESKATVGRFVTQMPLHEYFTNASDLTTASEIDAEVVRLEAEIKLVSKTAISDVDGLIDRNVDGIAGSYLYNLSSKYPLNSNDDINVSVHKLLALKSIQRIGTKEFEKLLSNTDLVSIIKDNVVANKISLLGVKGTSGLRDSLVPDYWKEPAVLKAVTVKEVASYMNGEESGWTVLREPTKTELGIVYKQIIDSTSVQGAYTDTKLSSTDVDVYSSSHKNYNNVSKAEGDSYKIALTPEEKTTLGIDTDFVESLVKGTAHSIAVKDSQSIRDAIIMSENRFVADTDSKLGALKNLIKADNADAPWFVKLSTDQTYSSLDPSVKAKYKQIAGRASDVEGSSGSKFSDEVTLVRKDLAHLLIGGSSKSLFDNKMMKWATRIVKDITAGTKIGMVVLNPVKIAIDNVSNLSYLSVSGASPKFIAQNYKEISRDYHDYRNIAHQITQLKLKLVSDPDNKAVKDKVAKLQSEVEANPVGDLAHKGFVNSLGSDLVARSSDTSSGMQADMQTALEYILINKKGNKNLLAHFITRLHSLGFQSEDYVKYLGGLVGRAKDGQGVEQQLDLAVARIKDIKTEDDIVSYVSQYTTSPGSELVRLGSSITDLTDVLAKETLYRHAMQNEGMSSEAARIHVLDSFPDYKENLPLSVKQLSDVGIIMFPSFWLRIQKAIYRLAKDKPVSLATELMIEQYVTGNVSSIIDANIINKSESFGGLFHLPLESSGIGSVVPQNLFDM
jgi:hypothetical protein